MKFTRCRSDHSLYHCHHNGTFLLVGCYVDDLIIISDKTSAVMEFKQLLAQRFQITDEGELSWILGMEVTRNRKERTLVLHQRKYINDILELFQMRNAHPSNFPAQPGVRLTKTDADASSSPTVDATHFRTIVGKLVYLMVATEPSIAFAVGQLYRFFSCPNSTHINAT